MTDELFISKSHFSTLIISDLILLCSSSFSNPLYLSYFLFFSPYLLRLISFLSPLLFTTLLISLALIIGVDSALTSPVLENDYPDDLGIYEILFGMCSTNCLNEENPLEEKSEQNPEPVLDDKGSSFCKIIEAKKMEEKNPGPVSELKSSCPVIEERRLENFLKILDQFEKMSTNNVDGKGKNGGKIGQADVVVQGVRQNAAKKINKAHSEKIASTNNVEKEHILKFESFRRWDRNSNSQSFGSMKKEKEWKRTLACKLFEERHNVDGGEGMDSLWEAYETKSDESKRETGEIKKRGKNTGKTNLLWEAYESESRETGEIKKRGKSMSKTEFSEELCGDEDEDEVVDGRLCCLNAIKFSAGKMNLGMGKPNVGKISKAIKGFGWLHHVSKYSKKVHNNGDR